MGIPRFSWNWNEVAPRDGIPGFPGASAVTGYRFRRSDLTAFSLPNNVSRCVRRVRTQVRELDRCAGPTRRGRTKRGAPGKVIAQLMGHAKVDTTLNARGLQ